MFPHMPGTFLDASGREEVAPSIPGRLTFNINHCGIEYKG